MFGSAVSAALPLAWRIGRVYGAWAGAAYGFTFAAAATYLLICWVRNTD